MVGAVGIENNISWSSKDLQEMLRSAKTLERNNEESSGILIGPSMAPRFFERLKFLRRGSFTHYQGRQSASGQILRHGWQADE